MKSFFVTTFLFLMHVFGNLQACEIELCSKFLILDNVNAKSGAYADGIVKNSNCTKEEQSAAVQFLTQAQGVFNTNILHRYFNNIIFRPAQIEIQKLAHDLVLDYSKNSLIAFVEKVHFHKSSLCVENSDILTSCDSCNAVGKKNITLTIRGNKNNYTIPIEVLMKTQVRAFVVERFFAPGEMLAPTQLKAIDLLTDSPSQNQINIEKIRFYSSTHPLNKGDILK
ncbi:MAG: hypothetical protein AABY86_17765, partial [Bdellovibrionota bacterium]